MISISDWVRAKVCDISQPSTHCVAVETHLRVTLSSSPPVYPLYTLSLLSPSSSHLADSPGVSVQLCFHMQGVSGRMLQCVHHPSSVSSFSLLTSLPQILHPFSPSNLFSFWSPQPPHVRFSSPRVSPPWLHLTAQVCLACRRLLRPGASKGQGAQRQETHPH